MMGEAKKTRIICPAHSSLFLDARDEMARLPRAAHRKRTKAFYDQFEDKALFYDCFWNRENNKVILIGPPPLNLLPQFEAATFVAQPSGKVLIPQFFVSRSTQRTQLAEVPQNTTHIQLVFGGGDYRLDVQQSLVSQFEGARILFTMNKDNDLTWISDWATYHVHHHQTDTIILFDNGSTRYGLDELAESLGRVADLRNLILFSWPYSYGPRDSRAWSHHYWPLFLQISSMSVLLHRIGMAADGILNCDVDELVAPLNASTIYDVARAAPHGIAALGGRWVEAVRDKYGSDQAGPPRHADFGFLRRDLTRLLCPKKWVLDPKRDWVKSGQVFPYMHRIMGAPERKITEKPRGAFWHFRGINTNWKEARTRPGGSARPNKLLHYHDGELAASLAALARLVPLARQATPVRRSTIVRQAPKTK